jgi:hypothetical protein
MVEKRRILTSIRKIAKRLGRTPTQWEFLSGGRGTDYSVSRFFPKWNDAVRAAGLQPYTRNARVEDRELLKDWGKAVRKRRGIPAYRAYGREGKYDPSTIERRFGRWSSLPKAFRNFAKGRPEWADVVALLPTHARRGRPRKVRRRRTNYNSTSPVPRCKRWCAALKDRPTYGDPIPFPWLRHEPLNEQGVVLLFGMLAKDLGYMVESVQKGFPDCEAKRRVGSDKWQRVRIEFEFESRNFRDHGHPTNGCDVIVCWRHNWDECPAHIEVIELSTVIIKSVFSQGAQP